MTRLSRYLASQLKLRDMNAVEFARRADLGYSHIYQILRGTRRDPGSETLRKIAAGLGMTLLELQAAMEGEPADDPIQRDIDLQLAAYKEAVRGTPRKFWAVIIRSTFDNGRHVAELLRTLENARKRGDNTSPKRPSRAKGRGKREIAPYLRYELPDHVPRRRAGLAPHPRPSIGRCPLRLRPPVL